MTSTLRTWARLLAATSALPLGLAAWFLADYESDPSAEYAGLGLAVAVLLAGLGAVQLLLSAGSALAARSRPGLAAALALVAGAWTFAWAAVAGLLSGAEAPSWILALAVVMALGVGTAVTAILSLSGPRPGPRGLGG